MNCQTPGYKYAVLYLAVIVLVILVQKENSVFGHAKVSRGITAAK